MSYNIHQKPSLFSSVYNPLRLVVASTNYSQSNFQYVADIYVSGQTGYTRLLQSPDPTNGSAYFDIQSVLASYVTPTVPNTTAGFQKDTTGLIAYEVKMGEQYGASSGITTYPNISVTGTRYTWNAVFSQKDWINSAYTSWVDNYDLSNKPTSLNYVQYPSSNRWHQILTQSSGTIYYLRVKTYNTAGTLLGTYLIANAYQAVTSYDQYNVLVNVGVTGLNAATLASGVQPVISSSVAYYKVSFTNFAQSTTVAEHTYYIDTRCTNSTIYTIHFRSELGAIDSFDFIRKPHYTSTTKRDQYTQVTGTRVDNRTWTDAVTDRGDRVYNTQIEDTCALESDWITETEATWLREMFESPESYIETSAGVFEPCIIQTSSYETKKYDTQKLFNVQLTVKLANKRWRQRG